MRQPHTEAGQEALERIEDLDLPSKSWLERILDIEAEARIAALDEVRREVQAAAMPFDLSYDHKQGNHQQASRNAVLAILDRLSKKTST